MIVSEHAARIREALHRGRASQVVGGTEDLEVVRARHEDACASLAVLEAQAEQAANGQESEPSEVRAESGTPAVFESGGSGGSLSSPEATAESDDAVRKALALASELHLCWDELAAPGGYGGYPWEHLGDADKDVRLFVAALAALVAERDAMERERDEARSDYAVTLAERDAALARAEELQAELDEYYTPLPYAAGYNAAKEHYAAQLEAARQALREIADREARSDYESLAAAVTDFGSLARAALAVAGVSPLPSEDSE